MTGFLPRWQPICKPWINPDPPVSGSRGGQQLPLREPDLETGPFAGLVDLLIEAGQWRRLAQVDDRHAEPALVLRPGSLPETVA
jgi:hypothetical protein